MEHGLFEWMAWRYGFWFRIFGYGLYADRFNGQLMFSERYGYTRYWIIGGFKFKAFKP